MKITKSNEPYSYLAIISLKNIWKSIPISPFHGQTHWKKPIPCFWGTMMKHIVQKKRVKNTQSPCFFSKIEKLPTIYRQLRNWWRKVKHCWSLLSGTRKEQRKRWLNRGLESSPTSAVGPPISEHQGMTAMLVIRDGIIVKTNTESLAYTLTSTLLA